MTDTLDLLSRCVLIAHNKQDRYQFAVLKVSKILDCIANIPEHDLADTAYTELTSRTFYTLVVVAINSQDDKYQKLLAEKYSLLLPLLSHLMGCEMMHDALQLLYRHLSDTKNTFDRDGFFLLYEAVKGQLMDSKEVEKAIQTLSLYPGLAAWDIGFFTLIMEALKFVQLPTSFDNHREKAMGLESFANMACHSQMAQGRECDLFPRVAVSLFCLEYTPVWLAAKNAIVGYYKRSNSDPEFLVGALAAFDNPLDCANEAIGLETTDSGLETDKKLNWSLYNQLTLLLSELVNVNSKVGLSLINYYFDWFQGYIKLDKFDSSSVHVHHVVSEIGRPVLAQLLQALKTVSSIYTREKGKAPHGEYFQLIGMALLSDIRSEVQKGALELVVAINHQLLKYKPQISAFLTGPGAQAIVDFPVHKGECKIHPLDRCLVISVISALMVGKLWNSYGRKKRRDTGVVWIWSTLGLLDDDELDIVWTLLLKPHRLLLGADGNSFNISKVDLSLDKNGNQVPDKMVTLFADLLSNLRHRLGAISSSIMRLTLAWCFQLSFRDKVHTKLVEFAALMATTYPDINGLFAPDIARLVQHIVTTKNAQLFGAVVMIASCWSQDKDYQKLLTPNILDYILQISPVLDNQRLVHVLDVFLALDYRSVDEHSREKLLRKVIEIFDSELLLNTRNLVVTKCVHLITAHQPLIGHLSMVMFQALINVLKNRGKTLSTELITSIVRCCSLLMTTNVHLLPDAVFWPVYTTISDLMHLYSYNLRMAVLDLLTVMCTDRSIYSLEVSRGLIARCSDKLDTIDHSLVQSGFDTIDYSQLDMPLSMPLIALLTAYLLHPDDSYFRLHALEALKNVLDRVALTDEVVLALHNRLTISVAKCNDDEIMIPALKLIFYIVQKFSPKIAELIPLAPMTRKDLYWLDSLASISVETRANTLRFVCSLVAKCKPDNDALYSLFHKYLERIISSLDKELVLAAQVLLGKIASLLTWPTYCSVVMATISIKNKLLVVDALLHGFNFRMEPEVCDFVCSKFGSELIGCFSHTSTTNVELSCLPIAVSLCKIVAKLPEDRDTFKRATFNTIVYAACQRLKSRVLSVRNEARSMLAQVSVIIGAYKALEFVVLNLRLVLIKGYQRHVLAYTVWHFIDHAVPRNIDRLDAKILPSILAILYDDLFGSLSAEKTIASSTRGKNKNEEMVEKGSSKSLKSLQLISLKLVPDLPAAMALLLAMRKWFRTTANQDHRMATKCCVAVADGLSKNSALSTAHIIELSLTLIDTCSSFYHTGDGTPMSKEISNFTVLQLPKRKQAKPTCTSSKFVLLGLDILAKYMRLNYKLIEADQYESIGVLLVAKLSSNNDEILQSSLTLLDFMMEKIVIETTDLARLLVDVVIDSTLR